MASLKEILNHVFATGLQITPDGRTLVFANSSMAAPPEIYAASMQDGTGLTTADAVNAEIMSRADLKDAEEMEWTGALGKKIHGFLVKPANFDPNRKVSAGGLDSRRTTKRLEQQLELSLESAESSPNAGYVVFMPNPRGSTGYGQQFVNEISG